MVCRTTSVIVTLSLAKCLGVEGYGRIEFAFNVVFWLVLLLRDSSDVIVARELSRHPRLIRPLVDQVLAYKTLLALVLFCACCRGIVDAGGPFRLADLVAIRFDAFHDRDWSRLRVSRHGAHGAGRFVSVHSHRHLRIRCSAVRSGRQPDRLGSGLADRRRGGRDWSGMDELFEELPPASAADQFAVSVDHGAAWPTVCSIQLSQAVIISADLMVVCS